MALAEDDRVAQVYGAYATDPRKAAAWAADNPGNRAIREEVAAVIVPFALATAGPVLDAGCGAGWWLGRLAAAGAASGRLTGVDLLPERAAAAAGRAPGGDGPHRLGRATPRLYPALARLPPLRSHRLMEWRRPPPSTSA